MKTPNYLSEIPLDNVEISPACLNIEDKERSNLFPWNGQFSPQFVEVMLKHFAQKDSIILDPFCGSGTVLAEASRLGLSATGIEINPAAYILARVYSLSNIKQEQRFIILDSIECKLKSLLPNGWPLLMAIDINSSETYVKALLALLSNATRNERIIIEAFIILIDFFKGVDPHKMAKTWLKLRRTVEQLPHTGKPIISYHADGRYLESKKTFDVVFTSPPYINVYNYHQQYRASAEALGWDLLHVAKTEIGSNRKNRGNRFLTVSQYCLDLAICLDSLWKATTNNARIIFVMGRESRVRGVPFFNGEIVARLAIEAVGYSLVQRQERVFTNRFGQKIYEDILHLQKPCMQKPTLNNIGKAHVIAASALQEGLDFASTEEIKRDLCNAIEKVPEVAPSPRYIDETNAFNHGNIKWHSQLHTSKN